MSIVNIENAIKTPGASDKSDFQLGCFNCLLEIIAIIILIWILCNFHEFWYGIDNLLHNIF